ncbi:hypothetical protein BC938DRAFT_480633 [Jimgerdemannia flammicorona]|uniref:Uncharacterized protein n=1 Tax=Jimgerdemannia flammicorona TaxID=994334 RepID=A0A433QI24_9FUNG|nr:hypothetical protein BC938DRAFT_480633 [Jimgerdemannia flammicorona]
MPDKTSASEPDVESGSEYNPSVDLCEGESETSTVESDQALNSTENQAAAPPTETSDEEYEQFDVDLEKIRAQLKMEPLSEWKVGTINVTQRFRQFQKRTIDKAFNTGLTWNDTYEILALASILVLCTPCPYPNFTKMEWHEITACNPYATQRPVLPSPVSATLQEATRKHVMGADIYMNADDTELSRAAARIFNDLRDLPLTSPVKMSEDLHCCKLLHPHIRSVFLGPLKEYETRLNRSVKNTKQRPDFSCVVDDIPMLNSEFKPLGHTALQKKKDFVKVHLRAKRSIEQQLKTKGGPGEAALLTNMGM